MKMKDFHFFIYDEVQITPNIFSFNCSQTDVFCAVIDKVTHCANRTLMGNSKTLLQLHVITQSDFFLSDLQKIIFI